MRAAVAVAQNATRPLSGLRLMDVPEPEEKEGWARVRVKAATLNPHDIWTLRGIGHPPERIPMIMGCDASGVLDDGREVIVFPVIADAVRGHGDETFDPDRAVLSETIDGGLAEVVSVPSRNLVPKPSWLSFEESASVGVVWATAYRMLFTRAAIKAGDRILVQGASGGVAGAAISLAAAAGACVYATARTPEKREYALRLGAHQAFAPGARIPERVDTVVETVGEATWKHSLRAVRPGGTVVIAGAASGAMPDADLRRIFYKQLSIVGSTMCTRSEFDDLLRMMHVTGLRPSIDSIIGFEDIHAGYARLDNGQARGKIVVRF